MASKDMTYPEALHAVQSGIAFKIEVGIQGISDPKHLRVGIDSAFINDLALAKLLINKGVFTEEEYKEAVRQAAIDEVERLEKELSFMLGKAVTLG